VARAAGITLVVGLVALPLGTALLDTTGAALAVLLAETAGTVPYVLRRRLDGWKVRDALPGALAAVVVAAAVVAGLLLPALSAVVLLPAAVATLAPLAPLLPLRR
jgi:hypothetical protein